MPGFLDTIEGLVNGDFGGGENGPAYLKSSSTANVVFGLNQPNFVASSPYLGFQYYVKFNFDGDLAKDYLRQKFNWAKNPAAQLSPMVVNVDMPSLNIATDKLNEYNRWRVSQTKVEYEPIKMTILDTVDGVGSGLWKAYYDYYFADGLLINKENIPVIPDAFTASEDFGYNLAQVADIRYLIKSIVIYQLHGNSFNKVELYNPKITSFSPTPLSYEDSGKLQLDYTFEYEYLRYHQSGMVPENGDIWDFLATADVPQMPFGKDDSLVKDGTSILDDLEAAKDQGQSLMDDVKQVKRIAKSVAGQYAQASATFNQVQMDVLGTDTPLIEAPSVREFSAVVNTIPTGYPDIRRSSRKVTGGKG